MNLSTRVCDIKVKLQNPLVFHSDSELVTNRTTQMPGPMYLEVFNNNEVRKENIEDTHDPNFGSQSFYETLY
jgi:hypothetical protein